MPQQSSMHAEPDAPDVCWAVTEGAIGMENQAVGLAEAVGLPTVVKRVTARAPWRYLPAQVWPKPLNLLTAMSDPLLPPWPDLLISCGRRSAPFSMAVRRASAGKCFTVHIQDPKVGLNNFDLVVPPRHDGVTGPNVIVSRGALNRITADKLADGARRLAPRLAHLPRPLLAVLLGGTSNSYKLTTARMSQIGRQLRELIQSTGAGLAITPSRRTGAENIAVLRRELPDEKVFLWDGTGDNPYFGLLGLADAIAVTCESASMVSEAATTGRPLYVIELEGGSKRFHTFHEMLRTDGVTRPFDGHLEKWSYDPLNDTAIVAAAVRQRLGLTP